MTKVAIQGIAGSFHNEAARLLVPGEFEALNCETFADVFTAVRTGTSAFGVVAVENSLQGSINTVYRLLAREKPWVSGEVFLKIDQYLITASPSLELNAVERVISQAPALAQCELWLAEQLPHAVLEESHDTAASVRYVMEHAEEPLAAVAGKHAAELYGGHILSGPINDDARNYTRFFLLTRQPDESAATNKTSIILETAHAPGSLQRALQLFTDADVNLSKLDSHPIPGDKWHYAFYLDFETGIDDPVAHTILDSLKAQGCSVTVLGSYQAAALPA